MCLATLAASGCGGARFVTAPEGPAPPRQPDGVILEPEAAVPATRARSDARGVVALREPRDLAPYRELAAAYVRAVQREDLDAVLAMLTLDAVPLFAKGRVSRGALLEGRRSRLRSLDYSQIAGLDILREAELEASEADELTAQGRPRPLEMRATDLLVRVPVAVDRLGSERYFGHVLLLLVRRDEGRLRIAGIGEEER